MASNINLDNYQMTLISVIVADDHTLFRRALIRLLKTFNRVNEVHEASNGGELLQLLKKTSANVVLMDIQMPVMDGFQASEGALKKYPNMKVLALTMLSENPFFTRLMELGVHGILLKNCDERELEDAIYSAVDNDFCQNEWSQAGVDGLIKLGTSVKKNLALLSKRENEILHLIYQGLTSHEISKQIGISKRTVDIHRRNLLRKLQADNSIQMLKNAFTRGLLRLDFTNNYQTIPHS